MDSLFLQCVQKDIFLKRVHILFPHKFSGKYLYAFSEVNLPIQNRFSKIEKMQI